MSAENYYCLASDGLLYALGNHGDYEAANDTAESLGLDVIWMFGEATRDSWRDSLNYFHIKAQDYIAWQRSRIV
jgi:hypothetical protein